MVAYSSMTDVVSMHDTLQCGDVIKAGVLTTSHSLHMYIQVSDAVIPGSNAVMLESNSGRCGNHSYQMCRSVDVHCADMMH